MIDPLCIGVSGAGRVFERLYAPALRGLPEIEVVAVADPVMERCAAAPSSVERFYSLPSLLETAAVDAIIVLSPPGQHAPDARLALERNLPVLVEKPLCVSPAELDSLRSAGAAERLTPALSRRYWPAYRRLAARRPVRDLRLAIAVDPGGWGAYTGAADIADDLFPHVADLARWLTATEIQAVSGRRTDRGIEAALEMEGEARVTARLDTRAAYREAARADGRSVHVGPPRTDESLLRRLLRRDDPAVEAVQEMVRAWVESVRGGASAELPRFEDGAASVAAMEHLRAALAANPSPV